MRKTHEETEAEETAEVTIIDVIPADDLWLVATEGTVLTTNTEKQRAVSNAREIAMGTRPSRLVIRSADGEIETITPFLVEPPCRKA